MAFRHVAASIREPSAALWGVLHTAREARARLRLLAAVEVRAGGVDEDQVERLREEISVAGEEVLLERLAHFGEEADRTVEMLQLDRREAGALDGAQPSRALQVAARGAQPLQGEGEGDALEVELEAAIAPEPPQQVGESLFAPQTIEDESRAPRTRGVRVEPLGPHLLDDAKTLAELGERREQRIEGAVGDELVAAAEVADHALSDLAPLAHRLDDLEVLVAAAFLDATLEADEHAGTMANDERQCKGYRPAGRSILGTTFHAAATPSSLK